MENCYREEHHTATQQRLWHECQPSNSHRLIIVMQKVKQQLNGAPRGKLTLPSRRIDVCVTPVTFHVGNWEDALLEHAFMTNMNEAKCEYA